ncbi:MAG: hypothetical protein HXX11_01560 [Desulfuromonadales bacterium]|nr:hypothetical protein [Desulfuromonadales bacterium]
MAGKASGEWQKRVLPGAAKSQQQQKKEVIVLSGATTVGVLSAQRGFQVHFRAQFFILPKTFGEAAFRDEVSEKEH